MSAKMDDVPIAADELRKLQDSVVELLQSAYVAPLSGTPTASAGTTSDEVSRKPLACLSIDEVVTLFRDLQLPEDCEPVIRRENITGDILNDIKSFDDIRKLELPISSTSATLLLQYLEEYCQYSDIEMMGTTGDLTTVDGISGALNQLLILIVKLVEDASSDVSSLSPLTATLESQLYAAVHVLDAIPTFIGRSDERSKGRMKALGATGDTNIGATGTRVIENLRKILGLLLGFSPSEPSYFAATTMILTKTLVATQRMMRYDVSDPKTSCDENMKTFLGLQTIEMFPEFLKKYVRLEVPPAVGSPISRVLTECCKAMRCIISNDDDAIRMIYGEIPGAISVLVDILKYHGRNNIDLAEHCFAAIINVTLNNNPNRDKYGAVPGSIEVMVDLLKYHGHSNPVLAHLCCGAIANITYSNQGNKEKYGSIPGSMEVLVDILRSHGLLNVNVANYCCAAILSLAVNAANREKLGSVPELFDSLVDVLRRHGRTNATVVYSCCGAITNVSISENNADKFGSTEIFPVLIDMLKIHGKTEASKSALHMCCAAVLNLSTNNMSNRGKFITLKTIQVLQTDVTVDIDRKKDAAIDALRSNVFFLEMLVDVWKYFVFGVFVVVAAVIMHMYNTPSDKDWPSISID